jgi:hypothetical protein
MGFPEEPLSEPSELAEEAPPSLTFDYVVFCWPGWERNATGLARSIGELGRAVTVLGSGSTSTEVPWVTLSNDAYFGDQFRAAIGRFDADVLVHIQADATIDDVSGFVSRVEEAFRNERIGIWAPDVDHTFWRTQRVGLGTRSNSALQLRPSERLVVNTDCTCWALRASVIEGFRSLNLSQAHYGWGLDFTGAALAYLDDLLVVRDLGILVTQPMGTGYALDEAATEFEHLLAAMPTEIRGMVNLLRRAAEANNQQEKRLVGRLKSSAKAMLGR